MVRVEVVRILPKIVGDVARPSIPPVAAAVHQAHETAGEHGGQHDPRHLRSAVIRHTLRIVPFVDRVQIDLRIGLRILVRRQPLGLVHEHVPRTQMFQKDAQGDPAGRHVDEIAFDATAVLAIHRQVAEDRVVSAPQLPRTQHAEARVRVLLHENRKVCVDVVWQKLRGLSIQSQPPTIGGAQLPPWAEVKHTAGHRVDGEDIASHSRHGMGNRVGDHVAGHRAATMANEVDHGNRLRCMGYPQARHDLHHHVAPARTGKGAHLLQSPRCLAVIGIADCLYECGGAQPLHQLLAIGRAPVIRAKDVGQQPLRLVAAVTSAQAVDVVDRHAEASWSRDAA